MLIQQSDTNDSHQYFAPVSLSTPEKKTDIQSTSPLQQQNSRESLWSQITRYDSNTLNSSEPPVSPHLLEPYRSPVVQVSPSYHCSSDYYLQQYESPLHTLHFGLNRSNAVTASVRTLSQMLALMVIQHQYNRGSLVRKKKIGTRMDRYRNSFLIR